MTVIGQSSICFLKLVFLVFVTFVHICYLLRTVCNLYCVFYLLFLTIMNNIAWRWQDNNLFVTWQKCSWSLVTFVYICYSTHHWCSLLWSTTINFHNRGKRPRLTWSASFTKITILIHFFLKLANKNVLILNEKSHFPFSSTAHGNLNIFKNRYKISSWSKRS